MSENMMLSEVEANPSHTILFLFLSFCFSLTLTFRNTFISGPFSKILGIYLVRKNTHGSRGFSAGREFQCILICYAFYTACFRLNFRCCLARVRLLWKKYAVSRPKDVEAS
jgi:hypothetical protein